MPDRIDNRLRRGTAPELLRLPTPYSLLPTPGSEATILFATIAAGGGHVATARAMAEAVDRYYPGRFELRVSDYMKSVGLAGLDRRHKETWRFMLRYPVLARTSQRVMDAFPRATIAVQRRLVREFARAAARDLSRDPPLLIVSNHGLITTTLVEARRLHGLSVPVLSFATEPHDIGAYWADPAAEHVVVPTEETRRTLARFGVPEEKMTVVGYPVRQAFLNAPPKSEARERLGLEDRFTCFVAFGGEGVGTNQREPVRALLDSGVQVVAVAGRNETLRRDLAALGGAGLRAEGFVEDVSLRMAAGDVFVGKGGPAAVYEALATGRPALITGYAGLNERGVARFVEENGLGRRVGRPGELVQEVERYARDPALLGEVALRCGELDLAGQTRRLARHVVEYAASGKSGA